jgi:vacuolar-type H+-ATPase subunit D/Vma8
MRRLASAERGRALLEKKLRILRIEQERFELLARAATTEWERSCHEAETWLLRARLVAGERPVLESARAPTAQANVTWRTVMGVAFPAEASCEVALRSESAASTGTAALLVASSRYEVALRAAVACAAAQAAVRTITDEVAVTRVRLRGIEDRWLPRLREALASLDLALEQLEHEEGVRRRWTADSRARTWSET